MDELERPGRARRSDAGSQKITPRDREAFTWLAEMKAAYSPDLAVLLGRMGGTAPLSADVMRKLTARWHRAGLAKSQKVLTDAPPVVMLLPNGAGAIGEASYVAQSVWTMWHSCEVSRARLWLEGGGIPRLVVAEWESERRYRQRAAAELGRLLPGTHVPDAVLHTATGQRVAVEVERTPKNGKRLDGIVAGLTRRGGAGGFDRVLYLVTTASLETAVTASWERVQAAAAGRELAQLTVRRMPEGLA